ncbi:MAG: bifunctional phosphoribosylaminoimidazolecarboxamide formyltransferase/IMP cyclohydrolase [Phycisphaerales bacterium]|nr:bifunctional phosphoribosylaminoimidazolecarboxamide formyltransferase/IMP cyclohydrolase [Phycisphaerales bacterium]
MTSTAHAEAIAPDSRPQLVKVARALVSVSDKAGIIELAKVLHELGIEIISTGGTAKAIADAGIPVIPIDEVTGFPEMMDGRVKTLHPKIHGGLLARRDLPAHVQSMNDHDIKPIDLVIVNLYPFESTIAKDGVTDSEAIEQIDIGGPSMVRSAAKNHASVAIVTDPSQYESLIKQLKANNGQTTFALRQQLAAQAFVQTASYDAMIAQWMTRNDTDTPDTLTLSYRKIDDLRYGENPHQSAASYRAIGTPKGTLIDAEQLHGKPLSFNNLNDASAALELVRAIARVEGTQHAAIVLKHTNPCGAASSTTIAGAIDHAIAGDPMAAFGGILASSTQIDLAGAQRIAADGTFFEVVIAPSYAPDALELLCKRWKNLRILAVGNEVPEITTETKYFPGGLLVQDRDMIVPNAKAWTHAAGPTPSEDQLGAAAMLESVCRALSSNAVLVGGIENGSARLFGAGAGQMDRVASCLGAVRKAGELCKGSIALSDAFFPFPDGPQILIDASVSMIVQPGGSKRDNETFELCDKHNVTCMTTGVRHFRH